MECVLRKAVGVRADACCLAISSIQQTVQSVISGLVAADGACRSCLPRHAADAAVILGRPVAGVIIQILRELRSADARQPAAYIIGVSLPVRVGAVQRLRLQTTKVIISIGSKRHLRPSQCMLHLGEPVCMVIAVSVCFRPAVLPACRVRMRHRGRLVRKGIDRGCHVVPVTESVPLQVSMLLYEIPCLHPT